MAALYWRHKKNGKWTWTKVRQSPEMSMQGLIADMIDYDMILPLEEEE